MARFGREVAFVILVALAAVAASGASNVGAPHPPPVKAAPGHGVALCPNPVGLRPFTPAATRLAAREAGLYGRKSLAVDLGNADRAWWPRVRVLWRSARASEAGTVVLGSQPAASSGFAVFLRPACGLTTLELTLVVTVGPSRAGPGPHCNACNTHLFYIHRRGRPLLWFAY